MTAGQLQYWEGVDNTGFCNGCIDNGDGVPDCMGELGLQLLSVFGVSIFVSNMMEVVSPIVQHHLQLAFEAYGMSKKQRQVLKEMGGLSMMEKEAKLKPYNEIESFKDYSEMVIQYGFVTLFVVAFPLTPLLAFMNNVLEQHVDGFKLVSGFQRPFPTPSHNIGVWFYFLDVVSTMSVVTNCWIVFFTSDMFPYKTYSKFDKLLLFIVVENLLLFVKRLVTQFVPDSPAHVNEVQARFEHSVTKIFKGFEKVDVHSSEVEEALNLEIEENPVRMKHIKITAEEAETNTKNPLFGAEGDGEGEEGNAVGNVDGDDASKGGVDDAGIEMVKLVTPSSDESSTSATDTTTTTDDTTTTSETGNNTAPGTGTTISTVSAANNATASSAVPPLPPDADPPSLPVQGGGPAPAPGRGMVRKKSSRAEIEFDSIMSQFDTQRKSSLTNTENILEKLASISGATGSASEAGGDGGDGEATSRVDGENEKADEARGSEAATATGQLVINKGTNKEVFDM
jgi:hypothetical protein